MFGSKFIQRAILVGTLTAGLLLAVGVPQAGAADRFSGCNDRMAHAQTRLDRDITRHGEHSRQAERDRLRVEDAMRWCRIHHAA